MNPKPAFWFAMLAASALGPNVGDYWADDLGLAMMTSFVSLAVIFSLLIPAFFLPGCHIDRVKRGADRLVIYAHCRRDHGLCPSCGTPS